MVNNFKLPKQIKRIGILETNSSSSHTLAIALDSTRLVKRGDPDFNLQITEDNKLRIPAISSRKFFGSSWDKYSDCFNKLLYAAALAYSPMGPVGTNYKHVTKLKAALVKYLNVDEVIFDWDLEYIKNEVNDPSVLPRGIYENTYIFVPEVDHMTSSDSYKQVFESEKTIIYFIFSRDSVIYCGNDDVSLTPKNYFEEILTNPDQHDIKINPISMSRVYFDEYYDVDFIDCPVKSIDMFGIRSRTPQENFYGVLPISNFRTMTNIGWNVDSQRIDFGYYYANSIRKMFSSSSNEGMEPPSKQVIRPLRYLVEDEEGNIYTVFMAPNIHSLFSFVESESRGVNFCSYLRSKFTDGIDYKLLRTKLYFSEFKTSEKQ